MRISYFNKTLQVSKSGCFPELLEIVLEQFIEIGKKEPETSEDELIAVFRDMDVDKSGSISYHEMLDALTKV